MGIETINQLIEVEDDTFKKVLKSEYNEYKKIFDLSQQRIQEKNEKAKEINTFSKISTYAMINMNTLMNKSPSHISEMMIRGSTMGIVDITKKIKEYDDADKVILNLANDLLKFEQRNI